MKKYILALDQGTTSSRAILFDLKGNIINIAQKEFTQIYPKASWVEHNPQEILDSQIQVLKEVVIGYDVSLIASIGITNQRETTIIWDKQTKKPIYNAIVWQCRRTASICEDLIKNNHAPYIKEATGLVVDAYFSATKVKWILDNVKGAKEKALNNELMFGTVESYLIYNLSKDNLHMTEITNASRTMMFNINTLTWDEKILNILDIPKQLLPVVKSSSEIYTYLDKSILGIEIPISGCAGDQQAALFGQACFDKGMIKNTYGTGCFMLMQTQDKLVKSNHGLLTTIASQIKGTTYYALEGSVFIAGAAIQWLRDELNILDNAAESEKYANSVEDSNGVYVVPAFSGLGAPYWDMYARGTITGLTRGTNRAHIIRATLESLAYQSLDLIKAMELDSNLELKLLKVDGGASNNNFLMQFQADILDKEVIRPVHTETTALGAAFLSGLAVGIYKDLNELKNILKTDKVFKAHMDKDKRDDLVYMWNKAISKSRNWIDKEE